MTREARARKARVWNRLASLVFIGSEGKEIENEVCAFPVLIAGNGGIIAEYRDPIRMGIPVNVVEIALNPKDSGGCRFDGNGGNGTVRDAVSDRGAEGV